MGVYWSLGVIGIYHKIDAHELPYVLCLLIVAVYRAKNLEIIIMGSSVLHRGHRMRKEWMSKRKFVQIDLSQAQTHHATTPAHSHDSMITKKKNCSAAHIYTTGIWWSKSSRFNNDRRARRMWLAVSATAPASAALAALWLLLLCYCVTGWVLQQQQPEQPPQQHSSHQDRSINRLVD